jgi:hypothetical protein
MRRDESRIKISRLNYLSVVGCGGLGIFYGKHGGWNNLLADEMLRS